MEKPQILLTNDDGIRSPGLWSAAEALSEIGFVHVIAPRDQFSGSGRSFPTSSDGTIKPQEIEVNGKGWTVYAVGGTPAQTVSHAILEILPAQPDILVSGINYGENVGIGITASGTVGAAMEAASFGIPSLAISLETKKEHHLSYSTEVNFSAAAFFTVLFSKLLLANQFPKDVDLLKVDIPSNATPDTPWEVTKLSRLPYFLPLPPERVSWDQPAKMGYKMADNFENEEDGTDIYALRVKRVVSVTPISLDMTSRINLKNFEAALREKAKTFKAAS